jgi:hypothetical protein
MDTSSGMPSSPIPGMPLDMFVHLFLDEHYDEHYDAPPRALFATSPWLTIITGHYGVGKTNLSLNIVRDLSVVLPRVTLVDLDIVNPYFRSTDNRAFLDACGVELFGPVHGASNLDTPSLSPGIDEAIRTAGAKRVVLIDVGGDPDGARALGRFSAAIAERPHRLMFVVNLNRPETASLAENLELLRGIEETSGLAVTEIFGNTHLKEHTTVADILSAAAGTRALADAAGLPLVGITAPRALATEVVGAMNAAADASQLASTPVYPVDLIIGTPWETQTQ